ncbi:MAG: hypothetical protein IV100_05205 [Myxococcales bacterium]|nr:hypothetical protein [Myxococcales bacterium]
MKTILWSVAACVAITASALALRTTPAGDPDEPTVAASHSKRPRALRMGATLPPPRVAPEADPIRTPLRPPAALSMVDEPVLAQLPSDTIFVAAVDHGLDFASAIDANRLLAEYGSELEDLEKLTAGIPDFDLYDTAKWGVTGIDPNGAVGIAVIDARNPTLVGFADIADLEKLKATLEILFATDGDKELAIRELEGCLILGEADESGELLETRGPLFVVRGKRVFALVPDGSESDVYARAEGIVYQEQASALISDAALVDLVDGLSVGRDGVMYVNIRAMVAAGDQSFDEDIERIESELETMQAARKVAEATPVPPPGAAVEGDVVGIESTPPVNDWDIDWRQRQLNEMTLMKSLLDGLIGSATGMAVGIELTDGHVDIEMTIGAAPDSMLSRLITTRSGMSPLRLSLPRAPWMLLDGALSPFELRSIVQIGFQAFGGDYEATMALAKGVGGFDKDPFELFTGELGFALIPPRPAEPDQPFRMPFDFVATLNVRDPALAQKVLNQAGGLATMAGFGRYVESTKGLALTLGGDGLEFAVVGRALIISTDPEAIEILARGGHDVASLITRTEFASHLPAGGQSGNWMMDMAMLSADSNMRGYDKMAESWPDADDDSAEARSLKAELRKLEDSLFHAPQRRRAELERERAALLGAWGATLTMEETGFRVRAAWYFGSDHLTSVLVRVGEIAREEATLWEPNVELQKRRDDLVARVNELDMAKMPVPAPMPIEGIELAPTDAADPTLPFLDDAEHGDASLEEPTRDVPNDDSAIDLELEPALEPDSEPAIEPAPAEPDVDSSPGA